jgi:hypothetical protein
VAQACKPSYLGGRSSREDWNSRHPGQKFYDTSSQTITEHGGMRLSSQWGSKKGGLLSKLPGHKVRFYLKITNPQ